MADKFSDSIEFHVVTFSFTQLILTQLPNICHDTYKYNIKYYLPRFCYSIHERYSSSKQGR